MYDDDFKYPVNGLKVLTVTQSTSPKLIEKLKNYMESSRIIQSVKYRVSKIDCLIFSGSKMYDPN